MFGKEICEITAFTTCNSWQLYPWMTEAILVARDRSGQGYNPSADAVHLMFHADCCMIGQK
jgi:hypothetical protein